MKQLRTYFYIVLFIPLLAGLCQANQLVIEDCVQCSHEAQRPCCLNNPPVNVSDECSGHPALSEIPCPHNAFCQEIETPVAVTANSTFTRHMEYSFNFISHDARPIFSATVNDVASRPPPLLVSRVRYILLCSFLI